MKVSAAPSAALARLSDHLDEAVIALRGRTVTALNRAAAAIFAVDPTRAVGRSLIEVVVSHQLEEVAITRRERELEIAGRILLARGVPGGLIVRDITRQRQKERELRETAAVLSHEFRTPVAAIASLLEALEQDLSPEQRERFSRIAADEARRLARLVEDLTVEFQPIQARRLPLEEVTQRARQVLAARFPEREPILMESGTNLFVRCDPDKLLQVLLNLLENAITHGPSGGRVSLVATSRLPFVEVAVRDEGGPLADYEGIFQARRRGKLSGPGSGLGLHVVSNIVREWGGTTWGRHLASAPGNEFGFTVPSA
jgi:signal transduction histidine kinase